MFATIVIPTRSRPAELARTLALLAEQDAGEHGCEIIIVDNASDPPALAPDELANGWGVRTVRLARNAGAAARNTAAAHATGEWLLMLDDDSAPLDDGWVAAARNAHRDTLAIGAEVLLPDGRHEAGGLPEVVVGCGALVRREAFLGCGGYDESFEYYGEETDLCARLIGTGGRVGYDAGFRILHRRSESERDLSRIIERLTRNEALTIWRYAPDHELDQWLERTLARRCAVAAREGVSAAYEKGEGAFRRRAASEPRRPLALDHWDRLTGMAFVLGWLRESRAHACAVRMPTGAPGKHPEVIAAALKREGVYAQEVSSADAVVAGTLAPGLALDAAAALRAEIQTAPIVAITPLLQTKLRDASGVPTTRSTNPADPVA